MCLYHFLEKFSDRPCQDRSEGNRCQYTSGSTQYESDDWMRKLENFLSELRPVISRHNHRHTTDIEVLFLRSCH